MLTPLLEQGHQYGAEYGTQLSNHLPMALIALDRIGATSTQQTSFCDLYRRRLAPQSARTVSIDTRTWCDYLGQHQYNADYHAFFASELETMGLAGTLQAFLPRLAPGLSGGAFHPLIRLAYALDAGDTWETAEALASWAMAYQELSGSAATSRPTSEPLAILAEMAQDPRLTAASLPGSTIFARMSAASQLPWLAEYTKGWHPAPDGLASLAAGALAIYAATADNFTALHEVTACHAMRRVLPFAPEPDRLLWHLWEALVAATMTIGCPHPGPRSTASPGASWDEILGRASASPDDHVVKFCYTAHEEGSFYKDDLYQHLAAQKAVYAL